MKWPNRNKDPNATFYSERAYKNYSSNSYTASNSPARDNPEVPLFKAMLDYEEKNGKTAEDKRIDDMLKNINI